MEHDAEERKTLYSTKDVTRKGPVEETHQEENT